MPNVNASASESEVTAGTVEPNRLVGATTSARRIPAWAAAHPTNSATPARTPRNRRIVTLSPNLVDVPKEWAGAGRVSGEGGAGDHRNRPAGVAMDTVRRNPMCIGTPLVVDLTLSAWCQ